MIDFIQGHEQEEYVLMKEDGHVGSLWTVAPNAGGLGQPPYVREVIETGATRTVLNKTYSNVTVLHQYLQGDPTTFATLYYCQGVGFLQCDNLISLNTYVIK
jgi:hypothetical protein